MRPMFPSSWGISPPSSSSRASSRWGCSICWLPYLGGDGLGVLHRLQGFLGIFLRVHIASRSFIRRIRILPTQQIVYGDLVKSASVFRWWAGISFESFFRIYKYCCCVVPSKLSISGKSRSSPGSPAWDSMLHVIHLGGALVSILLGLYVLTLIPYQT